MNIEAENRASFEESELWLKKTTYSEKGYEIRLIENLLNCYTAGFRTLKEFKTTGEISPLEIAWLLLVAQSFYSLRCAYDLLQKGYYNQAVILIRSAEENYLTGRHCKISERTIDALLAGKGKLKKFQQMAEDISSDFGKNWRINYGHLSEIAHPRQLAMSMAINSKGNKLNIGLSYDENRFIPTCQSLLGNAVQMTEFIFNLLGDRAEQWEKDIYPVVKEATDYLKQISETYKGNNQKENCSTNRLKRG